MFTHTSETMGKSRHNKGLAYFKLLPLSPSNPEDFALGKSITICKTSNMVTCIPTSLHENL